jgi:bifunctional DNase/RNase
VAVIRCVVESVRVHELTEQHVVNLKDDSGAILPIWIGPDTASAIGNALTGNKSERPLTHDLLLSAFEKLGVRVSRIGITGFVPFSDPTKTGGVFYATLYLERGTERIELDSRPSDAIALAVRTGAPIDVDEAIFAKSSVKPAR